MTNFWLQTSDDGLYVITRPNLLSTPGTLNNWADGRISGRHSEPTSFLVVSSGSTALPDSLAGGEGLAAPKDPTPLLDFGRDFRPFGPQRPKPIIPLPETFFAYALGCKTVQTAQAYRCLAWCLIFLAF